MKTRMITFLLILFSMNYIYAQQQELRDSDIIDAIEDQFIFDHAVDVNKINVSSNDGIVELTGEVNNIKAKERAANLALLVKGVRTVSNRINVSPPEGITDADVKKNVENALLNDPATESYQIDVKVNNGVVQLSGTVDSYQERELSGHVAKSAKGVKDLENNLIVNYKTDRPDFEIKSEIEKALKWNEWVDDGLIEVSVDNGNVTLSGVVGNASDKRTAAFNSWVAGVRSVDNNIEVKWWADNEELRQNKNADVTDAEIEQAIKDAALYDPRLFSFNIMPESDAGWVTLRGTVDNLKAKKTAKMLAMNTTGVNGVTNRLKIKTEPSPAESDIKNKIESSIENNVITEADQIEVSVTGGNVTLTGIVDSYTERNEAEWVASGVEGVNEVNNLLTVNYPYTYYWYDYYPNYDWYYPAPTPAPTATLPNDEEIKKQVEGQLWWSPFVDANQIDVSVNNGHVVLNGTVDSLREYRKATENAWEGGALSVDNQLVID